MYVSTGAVERLLLGRKLKVTGGKSRCANERWGAYMKVTGGQNPFGYLCSKLLQLRNVGK